MLVAALTLTVGLALIAIASDQFVIGAARVSLALRVSPVVIGAVVIGFGTSAPELVIGVMAASRGDLGLAIGAVVGSNIVNLTLVAGVAAMICPLVLSSSTIRRELPLSVMAVVLLAAVIPGEMVRWEGALLVAAFVGTMLVIVVPALRLGRDSEVLGPETEEFLNDAPVRPRREWARTLAGMGGTILAAHMVVSSAKVLATGLGVSDAVIGLTIVALGTSLPELVTAIQAARRGEVDLVIGNLLGSNIFNSLAIAGVAVLVGPGVVSGEGISVAGPVLMVGVTLLAAISMWTGRRLTRIEGAALVVAYIASLPFLVA